MASSDHLGQQFGGAGGPVTGRTFKPIYKTDLPDSETARATSKGVSYEEFQATAARGAKMLEGMRSRSSDPAGLNNKGTWTKTVHDAFEKTREPWGGATYNPRSGRAVNFHLPDKHVLSAREEGQEPVRVSPNANPTQFADAMNEAKQRFGKQMHYAQHGLGVFHDAEAGHIEIDPVVVVGDPKHREEKGREKAQAIGAATRAVGGAYHFASGNGVYPPHVKDAPHNDDAPFYTGGMSWREERIRDQNS